MKPSSPAPRVSVLMPTYEHARFIRRAIESLLAQTLPDWELVIVDDGSPDDTREVVAPYLGDERVRYQRLKYNVGLGAALNRALKLARAQLIAYLPSDDVYYPEHLASLVERLERSRGAVAACSGARHHYNKLAEAQIDGYPLQLVQVLHRRAFEASAAAGSILEKRGRGFGEGEALPDPPISKQPDCLYTRDLGPEASDLESNVIKPPAPSPQPQEVRWVERGELVTDDLERMFWAKLRARGEFVWTGQATCEWVDHPAQRHKLLREPLGGINPYRARFGVREPLRFHSSIGNLIDEVALYRRFRERPDTPPAADGLKILLVGELAYNADRVLALEERGHKLFGLWTPEPAWWNTVGPLPFGHVEDIARAGWRAAVRKIKPDVIYALLNWQAIRFAHHVLAENPGVPFVWHLKESPFVALEKGVWPQLLDLYTRADGQIYSSPEMRDWFFTVAPELKDRLSLVLDGDLPKREWFAGTRAPRLSEADGQIHTVVPGRPIGLHPWVMGELAAQGIHVHFYGDFLHGQWKDWIARAREVAEGYLHLHPNVDQRGWVAEFSQYDAGWLHFFKSHNGGDVRRMIFDDMNYPARIGPLIAAGLPLLQGDNAGAIVATQTLAREREIGLFFDDAAGLRARLDDTRRLTRLRANVWRQREQFTFDFHADRLVDFFRRVIERRSRM